jgi:GTP pyrophosphokinase
MKTSSLQASTAALDLNDSALPGASSLPSAIVAYADLHPSDAASGVDLLRRARAFAEPLLTAQRFDTGEGAMAHADGTALILQGIGSPPALLAAAYLVYASEYLTPPEEVVARAFGDDMAHLVGATRKLVQVQRNARDALSDQAEGPLAADQIERIRKMLLAFSKDLRVVLMRLASRLQTLRHYAETKQPCPKALARESLQVFAPLANRLGIWQIKWELEDLSFRFLQPDTYRRIALSLEGKRVVREQQVEAARLKLERALSDAGIQATVQGRPKHLYSIWKKMQGKNLPIDQVFDLQALRVIVPDVPACYAALSRTHELWHPLQEEFSDYIARPKGNGYQSLHTVVVDDADRPIEIQIRTQSMHDHAESGVAAHWAYKEAGTKGYAGVQAAGDFESRVAEARKTVLRQLLAWERDLATADDAATHGTTHAGPGLFEDRIYPFTPEGTIIDLPAGATPVDFAYTVHTTLGHRCRGAKVDGAMVTLNTPLRSGQTVEIVAAKEGGPSRDWLNADLGYVRSPRARAKVRAWFNALALQATIAKGRELVEKLLQRAGKTALKLDDLAADLGFKVADDLFEAVGKDEYSLRHIEAILKPAEPVVDADQWIAQRLSKPEASEHPTQGKGVLVVGVDSLLTQLARCCKPAPGDAIGGYVTRGKGVAVHRSDCSNWRQMSGRNPERVIPVTWGLPATKDDGRYSVDVVVDATDRPGLLRDVCDAFAQGKAHVQAMQSQLLRDRVSITLTVQTTDTAHLAPVLARVGQVNGVFKARRK